MERLLDNFEEDAVTFDLNNIFNENETTFEQVDTSNIPDNVLKDLLNTSFNNDGEIRDETATPQIGERSNTSLNAVNKKISNRFKVVTKETVDEIAGKSCKKRTHKQTEWGVKVFRGTFIHNIRQNIKSSRSNTKEM